MQLPALLSPVHRSGGTSCATGRCPSGSCHFEGLTLDERTWDELQIPVGLAFLFRNSAQDRTVAFYPGPAGATESELPLEAWDRSSRPTRSWPYCARTSRPCSFGVRDGGGSCHLVPIDACYELVGRLRTLWRGFDGGAEAHEAMDAFFAPGRDRSRPATLDGAV